MQSEILLRLIERYKADSEGVYAICLIMWEERFKAFRSIQRGVKAIAADTFGTDFKGSPLEVVSTGINEQKQVLAGAAHRFYWKPKLRIPDIYEGREVFGKIARRPAGLST